MSDTIPVLTVELLLKELKEVNDDWVTVGVLLGVPVKKLKTIKLDDPHGGVENWKIEMFHFWLRCKPDASWKDVFQALELTDHGLLAARVKRTYLLGGSGADEEEFETEVLADANVVRQLRDLETSFCLMLTKFGSILADRDSEFSKARTFLNRVCGSREFSDCGNSDDLLDQLCQGHHIDPFNLYRLKSLLSIFESEKEALSKLIEKYEEEKETFLESTTVSQFQRAVVEKVEPILQKGKVLVTIKILRKMKCAQTLKDIENLALEGFEDSQKYLVRMHAKPGSIIIMWVFPEAHSCELEESVKQNAAVFKDAGVEEVTVGGRVVFPSSLEEDIPTASLKEVYTDFYHRLVEVVSDEHTCQSLLTQLISSSALISEEKISQLTSSKVTGSSFLKTLGLEEDSRILVPLVSAMSGVEQLQTLAEKMDSKLHTRQEPVDKKEVRIIDLERQHEAEFRQLKTDKETEVKHLEDELTAANELLIMREKVISAMMVQVKETDTKQRIDSVLEEKTHSDSGTEPEHSSVEHRSFKIHYGDLFNTIPNPIALFDRLHTAHLLPQGTIVQMNMLPIEQIQELMDAIETSIQRDSGNFYKFVEVLEEDSSMQHLCGELKSTCAQLKSPVLVSSPLPDTSSTDGLDRHPKPDSSSSYLHSSSIISTDEAYSSSSSSSRYPSTAPVSAQEAIVQKKLPGPDGQQPSSHSLTDIPANKSDYHPSPVLTFPPDKAPPFEGLPYTKLLQIKNSELAQKEGEIRQLMGQLNHATSIQDQQNEENTEMIRMHNLAIVQLQDDLKLRNSELNKLRQEMRDLYTAITSGGKGEEYYAMPNTPHGICLIINNHKFHQVDPRYKALSDRGGAHVDQRNLVLTFEFLHYKVEVHENCTSIEMVELMKEMSCRDHSQYDSFVCCINTHGEEGKVFGADSLPVDLRDMTGLVEGTFCRTLIDKPKLFFVQAGREEAEDPGIKVLSDGNGSLPDFFFGYATHLGGSAYRSRRHGSWYISELCQVFSQDVQVLGLRSMMEKVNRKVLEASTKEGYRQCPEVVDQLRKEVHFFRDFSSRK